LHVINFLLDNIISFRYFKGIGDK
jgi:hypothetical protein